MKIIAYGCMEEEIPYLKSVEETHKIELEIIQEVLSENNVIMAKGYDGVSVLATCDTNASMIDKFKDYGVNYLGTRCVGYNHIDIQAASKAGIRVCNASYSEHNVADFVLMQMLMSLRKMPYVMEKNKSYNYTLSGIRGREMPNMTIGIIGTGRIGSAVASRLKGFGCRILAYDPYINPELTSYVNYVTLDELYAWSDIITFHAKTTDDNYHMFNETTLEKIKPGLILINAARGELVDTQALIKGLESKVIGAAAIDCFENEFNIIQHDVGDTISSRPDIRLLESHPNVLFTPHIAFYTDQAVRDMATNGLLNILAFENSDKNIAEIQL